MRCRLVDAVLSQLLGLPAHNVLIWRVSRCVVERRQTGRWSWKLAAKVSNMLHCWEQFHRPRILVGPGAMRLWIEDPGRFAAYQVARTEKWESLTLVR